MAGLSLHSASTSTSLTYLWQLTQKVPGLLPSVGDNWAAAIWHLKGLRICLISANFNCEQGCAAQNATKFRAIMEYIKAQGLRFVLAADWNMILTS